MHDKVQQVNTWEERYWSFSIHIFNYWHSSVIQGEGWDVQMPSQRPMENKPYACGKQTFSYGSGI